MNKNVLYDYNKEQLQDLLDHSNSYSDILRKLGLNPKGGNPRILKKVIQEYNLNEEKLNENRTNLYRGCAFKTQQKLRVPSEDFFADNTPRASEVIVKRLLEEGLKEYKCEICGISEWQNKKITLQLHHKDGKHSNNQLDNLQLLCPNCHSQTDTFAGKKVNRSRPINRCIICGKELTSYKTLRCAECYKAKQREQKEQREKEKEKIKLELKNINNQSNKDKIVKKRNTKKNITPKDIIKKESKKIPREELKLLVRTIPFVKIGKKFGVSDNAVRKWCKSYKLPYRAKDIKPISDEEWEKI